MADESGAVESLVTKLFTHFRGKSVFVTGHTGFKGSWLALWLMRLGARVSGYSVGVPTEPSNYVISRVREALEGSGGKETVADIRDGARLAEALKEAQPDVVFHLAAQPLVRMSYAMPRETFEVNVIGTASLLDGVRELRKPVAVVVATSDKCYENQERAGGYREEDAMGGFDPYSASKGASEILIGAYRRSFFHPEKLAEHGVLVASARAGNVIGGGDWATDRIVVDAVMALAKKQAIRVRNPGAIRPWQHVLEPLSGYLALAGRMLERSEAKLASGWNFGPREGDEASVKELVERLCRAWNKGVPEGVATWEDVSDSGALHEASILRLSIEKAERELGWKPRWKLEEAVERTAEWYKRYYGGASGMRDCCFADIAAYEAAGG